MPSSAVRRSVSITSVHTPPGGTQVPLWKRRTNERACLCRIRVDSSRRRDPERAVLRRGSVRKREVAVEARARLVLREHVDEVERVRRRRNVLEVELRHLGDGLEDRAELGLEARELLLGQREACELRNVEHLLSRD